MKGKYSSPLRESRSNIRGKRRKTNLILNMLIGLVILLIIVVSSIIFLGGNDKDNASKIEKNNESPIQEDESIGDDESQVDQEDASDEKAVDEEQSTEIDDEDKATSEETNDSQKVETPAPADDEDAVVTDGGAGDNVKKTIENPNWKPIGTSQTGEHTTVFDQDSVDWAEMLQTITYATGVGQDNMTIWRIGNNGHNKAIGTISSKDQKEKFRVYMEWVDGQGWKPTKVEELNEIDVNN